ncbi:MAG: hypothetical protein JSV89_12375 [Spirochaetaceae bacterium]|nr:MAG: hypothetical protein JSV89_12375 [Spirochaetaceae bacterium]
MLDLKPIKVSDRTLVLGTPWTGRIILFGTALVLGCVMAVNAAFSLVPGLLALITLLAAFYTEKWLFDHDRHQVVHTEGVLFIKKKKSFAFGELVRVELRNSRPTGGEARSNFEPESSGLSATPGQDLEQDPPHKHRGRGFSGLFLILVDGREVNIHTTSIRKAQEQDKLGRMISQVCRKPFSTYA